MNTVRTTARLEHSQPFAARCAFGTRNPLRRQRVIGGEGHDGRLETLAVMSTGNLLYRAVGAVLPGKAMTRRATLAREWASFSFSNHLANAGKHPVENGLQILHGASVASCSMTTSHHRRKTGCRPIQTTQEPVS